MVVRLKFSDGTTQVRLLSEEEILFHEVISDDEFSHYIEQNLDFSGNLSGWKFTDSKPNGEDIFPVDLREIFNYNKDGEAVHCVFEKDGQNCDCEVEIIDINSYEYTAAVLGLDRPENIYIKNILLDLEEDISYWEDWHRSHHEGQEYNDE